MKRSEIPVLGARTFQMLVTFAMLAFALQLQANAAVIFSDDFSQDTVGAPLPWTSSSNTAAGSSFTKTIVAQDTANLFGQGTDNKYALFQVNSLIEQQLNYNATTLVGGEGFGQTGQVTFKFYQPSDPANSGYGFMFRLGGISANSSSNTAFGLFFRGGALYQTTGAGLARGSLLANYNLDAVNVISIVFNNKGSEYSYEGNTLNAQSMDIWLNGVEVATNLLHSGGLAANIDLTWLNFFSQTTSSSTLYLDSIAVISPAAVPEPSIIGLSFLVVPILLSRFIRKNR